MKKMAFILIFLLSVSCGSYKDIRTKMYLKRGKDFSYTLKLNYVDSSFVLNYKGFEFNSLCNGKWQQIADTIFLQCCEEKDISKILQSGYMNQRDYKVVVINSKKLKIDNVVLRLYRKE